jgi:hypothetical protein
MVQALLVSTMLGVCIDISSIDTGTSSVTILGVSTIIR